MVTRKISKGIQVQILKYLEFNFKSKNLQQNQSQVIEKILTQIPYNMKQSLQQDFYRQVVLTEPIFKNLTNYSIQEITSSIQETTVKPGEYLFKKGDTSDKLYFLFSGSLQYILDEDKKWPLGDCKVPHPLLRLTLPAPESVYLLPPRVSLSK